MTWPLLPTLVLAISFQAGTDEDPTPAPIRQTIEIFVARGQNQEGQRLSASFPPPEGGDHAGPGQLRRGANFDFRNAMLDPENFDRWIFKTALTEADQQRHLEEALQLKIETASRLLKLTKAQEQKLRLAGRGDIKHFYDEVETKRREFEVARKTFQTGYVTLRRLNGLSNLYRDGPFVDASLFAKTLQKMRDEHAGEL